MNPRLKAWLEIIRLPAVLTAPGDPLAGMLLASLGVAVIPWRDGAMLCAASILFYMAGMILNDVMDIKEDTKDRPGRPIPSGRISALLAINVCGLLCIGGLVLCGMVGRGSLFVGALLLFFIFAYDLGLKKVPIFGPLCMGMCRGVNLLLGVSAVAVLDNREAVVAAVTKETVHAAFFLVTIYIAMVTMLARYETTSRNPFILRWYPLAVLVCGLFGLIWAIAQQHQITLSTFFFLLLVICGMYLAYSAGRRIQIDQRVTPPVIGQFLAVLLLLQSAFIFLANTATPQPVWWIGALLLLAWPVNKTLRKWIAAS